MNDHHPGCVVSLTAITSSFHHNLAFHMVGCPPCQIGRTGSIPDAGRLYYHTYISTPRKYEHLWRPWSTHVLTFAFAYPSLIVIFLSSSFLNRTVRTSEIAFTTVDFPWATCPIVPIDECITAWVLDCLEDAYRRLATQIFTKIYGCLGTWSCLSRYTKTHHRDMGLTCLEMTSGLRGCSVDGSISTTSGTDSDAILRESRERCWG